MCASIAAMKSIAITAWITVQITILTAIQANVSVAARRAENVEARFVASVTLVVDVLEQCAEIGELQHALAAGLMTRSQVQAELADVVIGRHPGRTRDDEITVFDSSGTALQDVAAAVAVRASAPRPAAGVRSR